jgi:hypothetical protein
MRIQLIKLMKFLLFLLDFIKIPIRRFCNVAGCRKIKISCMKDEVNKCNKKQFFGSWSFV